MQVKGKVRDRLEVPPTITEDELRELALASEAVQRALDGREVRTVVVRAPKLVNVVPVDARLDSLIAHVRAVARRRRHGLDGYLPAELVARAAASRSCRCRS